MHAACPSLEHLACYTLLVHTLIASIDLEDGEGDSDDVRDSLRYLDSIPDVIGCSGSDA